MSNNHQQNIANHHNKNTIISGAGGAGVNQVAALKSTSGSSHLNVNNNNNSNISTSGGGGSSAQLTSFAKFYGNCNSSSSEVIANGHGPRREVSKSNTDNLQLFKVIPIIIRVMRNYPILFSRNSISNHVL